MRPSPPDAAFSSKNLLIRDRSIRIWTSLAGLLLVVMFLVWSGLWNAYQRAIQSAEEQVAISVRPITQLQRELLRLQTLIAREPPPDEQTLSLQIALVTSRYNYLFEPYVANQHSPDIVASLEASWQDWLEIRKELEVWAQHGRADPGRASLLDRLAQVEFQVNDMVTRYELVLADRAAESVRTQSRLLVLFGFTGALFLLFVAIVAANGYRLLRERRQAVSLLQAARTQLEDRVRQRTAELQRTNEQLAKEVVVRQEAEMQLAAYSAELEHRVEERTQALRQAQSQLIRQEKLAALGALAGGVAHELRNPLGVISNAIYFLRQRLSEEDTKTEEYMALIERRVQQAEKIVLEMIDFASVQPARTRPCSIRDLVTRALQDRPPPESILVQQLVPADLPLVSVDRQQLQQVLVQLLANAYQAMPEGGTLTIQAAWRNSDLVLSVEDTGVGIPADALPQIFEPLFTTKAYGIGLGLAICKRLLEENDVSITVESAPDQGTKFLLHFTASVESAVQAAG